MLPDFLIYILKLKLYAIILIGENMDLEYYMDQAIEEAKKSLEKDEVPIGAVVVLNGEIIGRGHNTIETDKSSLAHAEINAIKEAQSHLGDWRLNGAYLFTSVEPCAMCAGAIVNARIDTLVYGCKDENRGFADSVFNIMQVPSLNHRVNIIPVIRENEAKKLIQDFFRKLREIK